MSPPDPPIIIVGAGIIGASIAYNLALLQTRAVVLEATAPAAAASGRAGGFLARAWCDGSPSAALARPSFDMHAALGAALPAAGYRRLSAHAAEVAALGGRRGRGRGERAAGGRLWMDGENVQVSGVHEIAAEGDAAQVHPRLLTEALLELARELVGTKVVIDRVVGVRRAEGEGGVVGVETENGGFRPCSKLILAMGPWTVKACQWLPGIPSIVASKATSIVMKAKLPAQAVFAQYTEASGGCREPEVYPREDEVYVCGGAESVDLPDDARDVVVKDRDVLFLEEFARGLSRELAGADILARQSCYLPVSPDGVPVIGKVDGVGEVYVAAGHGCWGILNSPATGKAVAEMVVNGESSTIDAEAFSPSRFRGRTGGRRR